MRQISFLLCVIVTEKIVFGASLETLAANDTSAYGPVGAHDDTSAYEPLGAQDDTTGSLQKTEWNDFDRDARTMETCVPPFMHQGVYIPDERFNAFVDGVIVNMISEMRRKRMDPLYFRVYDRGIIEHVPTGPIRGKRNQFSTRRIKRQTELAQGGGVIKGLTSVKRFGHAEVQVAGNTTLIRAHWLMGPLYIIVDYRGKPAITRVRTAELQAVQFDTLTVIDKYGAEMKEFSLYSPLFDYIAYFGNRTMAQQQTTEMVVKHLFSGGSFMDHLLKEAFEVASYDKIIPQFGVDDNYYSVLQYLFSSSQKGRSPRSGWFRGTVDH